MEEKKKTNAKTTAKATPKKEAVVKSAKKTTSKKEISKVDTEKLKDEMTLEVVPLETKISEEKETKRRITPLYIIKMILLVITAPIWLPWKILFVRRKGHKYKDVSTPRKVFRILRSPITKPLKFAVYIFIVFLEISLIYKLRYSPITYTITRNSVHNYYLQESSDKKLSGVIDNVDACELSIHYEEFKTAFSYVDEWNLSEKNKMYVILDSKAVKYVFRYAADEDITYLLTRFNSEETLRNDIKDLVANINKLIIRGLNEVSELVPEDSKEIKVFLEPITSLGKTLDYTVLLNTAGNMVELVEANSNPSTMQPNKKEDLDEMINTIIKYSKGASLKELGNVELYSPDTTTTSTSTFEIRGN